MNTELALIDVSEYQIQLKFGGKNQIIRTKWKRQKLGFSYQANNIKKKKSHCYHVPWWSLSISAIFLLDGVPGMIKIFVD